MGNHCLSLLTVSSLAAIVASEPANAAATQLCPGPALVSGFITGPIKNGSKCNLEATGTTVNEIFVGVSARDTDTLNLGSTPIFNNQMTAPGTETSQTVTAGSVLNFNLDNTNDPLFPGTYFAGTAYTNAIIPGFSNGLSPVYHFAWFDVTGAADVNTLFGATYINSTFDSIFKSKGGYSSWVFVGVEDSKVDESDDWNDTIYAFQNVAPVGTIVSTPTVPEPSTWVMMITGFAGLGFVGYRASRKSAALA
jgi:hypothetical protein